MREWCCRPEFRSTLPLLLPGEDADFQRYIQRIAAEEPAMQPAAAAVREPLPAQHG